MDTNKAPITGAAEEAIQRGHELDPIDSKPFIQFTVVMVVLFIVAWVLSAYAFDLSTEKWTPGKNVRTAYNERKLGPLATEQGNRSFDERLSRIDTYSPNAKSEQEKVYAPRLEAMRHRDFKESPEFVGNPIPEKKTKYGDNLHGNSPEYHAEDLHAENIDILKPVIENAAKLLKDPIFKHQKDAKSEFDPHATSSHKSKLSNAGFGLQQEKEEPKHEEKKH